VSDARRLYFTGPGTVELRTERLAEPGASELAVETAVSAVSNGTERLVYRGEVPDGMATDATLAALEGRFDYPFRYGYAAVGEVVDVGSDAGEEWVGKRVFAFEPHADRFVADAADVVAVPDDIGTEAASLLPTVETATNLVLDGAPRVGERVVVFGAGGIGLATTHVLSQFPLESLVVVEPVAQRRKLARAFGADRVLTPGEAVGFDGDPPGADLVYELSGRPDTLDAAVDAAGYDGRVVVGSWYGTKRHPVDLGGAFHRERIDLVSSQVSTIDPALRGRWTTDRRLDVAFSHLRTLDTATLVTHRIPLAEAEAAYDLLDRGPDDALQVVLEHR
jgi:2-desacetyl-2-hydroxyethyl bacteriochlorophyllide A dehydrogenase